MNDRAEVQSRRFYAQRNMYLCGFTLFLTLILTRTYSLVAELIDIKDKLDVLDKETVSPDSDDVATLKRSLKAKDAQLNLLKEQAAALSSDYDSAAQKTSRKKA